MALVKALVITGHGTNCERETAHAVLQAGADTADIVFFSDIRAGRVRIPDYNYLIFPGGFLDGDDLGAGQAAALRWRHSRTTEGRPILDDLRVFLDQGGLVLGICNGFQLLVKLGLLPAAGNDYDTRQVSLGGNDSARFEDRWVWLGVNADSPCVFTRGLDRLYLPIRHGEGKVVFRDPETMSRVEADNLVALRYVHPTTGRPTQEYPYNPNGSPGAIAGLTDPTGRIMGLMPHPESFNHPTNHPAWSRGETATLGTALLHGGVRHIKNNE